MLPDRACEACQTSRLRAEAEKDGSAPGSTNEAGSLLSLLWEEHFPALLLTQQTPRMAEYRR
jgi:hypothetical protein